MLGHCVPGWAVSSTDISFLSFPAQFHLQRFHMTTSFIVVLFCLSTEVSQDSQSEPKPLEDGILLLVIPSQKRVSSIYRANMLLAMDFAIRINPYPSQRRGLLWLFTAFEPLASMTPGQGGVRSHEPIDDGDVSEAMFLPWLFMALDSVASKTPGRCHAVHGHSRETKRKLVVSRQAGATVCHGGLSRASCQ